MGYKMNISLPDRKMYLWYKFVSVKIIIPVLVKPLMKKNFIKNRNILQKSIFFQNRNIIQKSTMEILV